MEKLNRVIISGGGTGGHIFPAIAIADEIKRRNPNAEILFIGALGKMEMEKVPDAGYEIVGLNIVGFQRKLTLSNFLLPFKIMGSLLKARSIIKSFKPQVVIGVGGYASGPTLKMAGMMNIPTVIQEQNSFPGKTNKLLAQKVTKICTAYEGMERFFPKEKIVLTGNPVRQTSIAIDQLKNEAMAHYGLDSNKKTILIIGGSLGARTLNQSVIQQFEAIEKSNIQLLWQCGKIYKSKMDEAMSLYKGTNIQCMEFISKMNLAYAAADLIISRAGAISISELTLVKKPVILVPSPNVSEDHQTKNAMSLVDKNAAILIKDHQAEEMLIPEALKLIDQEDKLMALSQSIALLGKPNATSDIVNVIESIV